MCIPQERNESEIVVGVVISTSHNPKLAKKIQGS